MSGEECGVIGECSAQFGDRVTSVLEMMAFALATVGVRSGHEISRLTMNDSSPFSTPSISYSMSTAIARHRFL